MSWCRVEYFGQKLEGFAFTVAGWVQSYGSRYVRPPIVHADVARRGAMTVKEFRYAQSLTEKPVKGMLTGEAQGLLTSTDFRRVDRGHACPVYAYLLAMPSPLHAFAFLAFKVTDKF